MLQFRGQEAANSVIMSCELRGKIIIFVEGLTDGRLIDSLFSDSQICTIAATGYQGVIDACNAFNATVALKYKRILGIVDRDYSNHTEHLPANVFTTRFRDIEIDLFETDAAIRLLKEKASLNKCQDPRSTLNEAYAALIDTGWMRFFNSVSRRGWKLNNIDLRKSFRADGTNDSSRYIQSVWQNNAVSAHDKATFAEWRSNQAHSVDMRSIVRGHDVSTLLGIWLKKKIGDRNGTEIEPSAIEENLRLAARKEDLAIYTWFQEIETSLSQPTE